ncbi:unnamed protein product [Moneuplotes crassus]|uniref:Uncharacterized protein n=1 Tax=Euplotes crassus TaxID=5936 RepID=A0AAD1UJR3_EUPCR|nr:unnamed protein product [Moneuplotes crassus]
MESKRVNKVYKRAAKNTVIIDRRVGKKGTECAVDQDVLDFNDFQQEMNTGKKNGIRANLGEKLEALNGDNTSSKWTKYGLMLFIFSVIMYYLLIDKIVSLLQHF